MSSSGPRRVVAGLLLPVIAITLAAGGLLISVPGRTSALAVVIALLIVAWALCGALTARAAERTPQWEFAAGAIAASVAAGAGRLADRSTGGQHHLATGVSVVAAAIMVAISVHLLLALPDGRLASTGRRAFAG